MSKPYLSSFLATLLLLTSGCLNFDLDPEDFACPSPSYAFPVDAPAAPLAIGARVSVFVVRVDAAGNVIETLTVESSNPSVLLVEAEDTSETASLRAVAEGTAEIIVRRQNGAEQGRTTITVLPLTSYSLYSRRALVAGEPLEDARVEIPHIVEQGTATFFVRAFSGTTELQLDGTLLSYSVNVPGSVSLLPLSIASATLTASELGEHVVPLAFRPSILTLSPTIEIDVPVIGVRTESITSLAFAGTMEDGADEDECLTAVALPRDAEGEVVEGAVATFTDAHDDASLGEGETLSYHYRAGESLTAQAKVGSVSESTMLHTTADAARGRSVSSSCTAGRGTDTSALLAMTIVLGMIVARRGRGALSHRA